jgi:hypothetical protein
LSPGAILGRCAALRFLFVKTLRRPYLLDEIPFPKRPRELPTVLSPDEVARLIDPARNLMHRAMLMTLYATGLRRADLSQHIAEIEFRIEAIELGRSDQAVHGSGTLPARVGTGKQIVLPRATARSARSAALLSISNMPSSVYRVRARHLESAYRIAPAVSLFAESERSAFSIDPG